VPAPDQVRGLLDQEVENLQSILSILQREYDALIASDITAIEQVTSLKNQALSIQAELARSRQHLLSADSHGLGTEDPLGHYVSSSGDAALLSLYERLSSLAAECHTRNRTNGRLIAQKRQQTAGALDILRHTDSTGATYSPHGEPGATEQSGRSLGKA